MNIIATQFTLNNKAYEVYFSGCSAHPHCKGCHNPESWDFSLGEVYDSYYSQKIINSIKDFDSLIDNIWLLGGEPLDQNIDDLISMVYDLKETGKKVWLFTRYELSEVQKILSKRIEVFDYIKCGAYKSELTVEDNIQYGVKLATANQYIYKKDQDY